MKYIMERAQKLQNTATSPVSNTYARRTVLGIRGFAKTLTKTNTRTYSLTQFETNVQVTKRTNNSYLNNTKNIAAVPLSVRRPARRVNFCSTKVRGFKKQEFSFCTAETRSPHFLNAHLTPIVVIITYYCY